MKKGIFLTDFLQNCKNHQHKQYQQPCVIYKTNSTVLYTASLFSCPFLHRTAGDTERRYHLRYYKTGTCVYETDTKGHCVKNGPHCAFAHGPIDLRSPVYDIRELQAMEQNSDISSSPGTPSSGSLEKDRLLLEDPRWNGMECYCQPSVAWRGCVELPYSWVSSVTISVYRM